MRWLKNPCALEAKADTEPVGKAAAQKAREFHRSIPDYEETPLRELSGLAGIVGIADYFLKDESFRFGLNSFKALGGAYAIGSYMAKRLGLDISQLPYERMVSDDIRARLGDITFISTTDGNHGRGVAWTANRLKQKCVIYMPKGTAKERLDNVKAQNAEAYITDMNYDDTIRMSAKLAEDNGWVTVQDTSWEGYEDIPLWIMQGYGVMALEALEELTALGKRPTHVFLQAGVGAMAAAATGLIANYYGKDCPIIVIMESKEADCYYRTASANDGSIHFAGGDMNTIMAGLACGEPITIGWPIIRDYASFFVSVEDYVTADGMRILASPVEDDTPVVSGESGAVGTGLLFNLMTNPEYEDLKTALNLGPSSTVLAFSTEGATDKENYRRVVWEGAYGKDK